MRRSDVGILRPPELSLASISANTRAIVRVMGRTGIAPSTASTNSSRLARLDGVSAPAPVKQLCGTHDRETQFEVAPPVYQLGDELCGSLAVPFGVDEDRRVDQESQDGRSSTGSPARTSSRSSPNRSSSTADDRPRR